MSDNWQDIVIKHHGTKWVKKKYSVKDIGDFAVIILKLESQLKIQTEKSESWKITAESNVELALMAGMLSDKNRCLEKKIDKLQSRLEKAETVIDFYDLHEPVQFPEGYYEICLEDGVSGHNRFGKRAREYRKEFPRIIND